MDDRTAVGSFSPAGRRKALAAWQPANSRSCWVSRSNSIRARRNPCARRNWMRCESRSKSRAGEIGRRLGVTIVRRPFFPASATLLDPITRLVKTRGEDTYWPLHSQLDLSVRKCRPRVLARSTSRIQIRSKTLHTRRLGYKRCWEGRDARRIRLCHSLCNPRHKRVSKSLDRRGQSHFDSQGDKRDKGVANVADYP